MQKDIRVRFAPSPTGGLHIGGVRTALYNYLFARQNGGKFILRIEDTDQNRYIEGAEEYIIRSLAWLGIVPEEGPEQGGAYGPYRQSERKAIYMEYAQKLIDDGNAYYAFDTAEELEAMRQRLEAAKSKNVSYNAISRMSMKNALTLPENEVQERIERGDPYVIRLKVPRKEEIRINDLVRGWVMVHSSAIDDKVLVKADGMPTYHMANIVDDHLMKISHVIRGEEWLPSAPLHVLLYQFLGWEPPQFAHLPLILKPDGNGKLSKRSADQLGIPIFALNWEESIGYKEAGYLPEAIVNFLALLGWHPSDHKELFNMKELIENFRIERISKSGAKFDIDKAKWFNQQYLKQKTDQELASLMVEKLKEKQIDTSLYSEKVLIEIGNVVKERAIFPQDLAEEAILFFQKPQEYDAAAVSKKWSNEAVDILSKYIRSVEDESGKLTGERLKLILQELCEKENVKLGKTMPALRLALTGAGAGPDIHIILDILGKEEIILRIKQAIDQIKL